MDKFNFLSNHFNAPILIDEVIYPSVYHYYQAMKSNNKEDWKNISELKSKRKIKRYIRKNIVVRSDWESKKVDVAKYGIYIKFYQHPELLIRLLGTDNDIIIKEADNYKAAGMIIVIKEYFSNKVN